jgi:hypothetical protein
MMILRVVNCVETWWHGWCLQRFKIGAKQHGEKMRLRRLRSLAMKHIKYEEGYFDTHFLTQYIHMREKQKKK